MSGHIRHCVDHVKGFEFYLNQSGQTLMSFKPGWVCRWNGVEVERKIRYLFIQCGH